MKSNHSHAHLLWDAWESVWQGGMRADQLAWQDVQDMEVIQRSIAKTASLGPLAREAFLGLYGQLNTLVDAPAETLRLTHRILGQTVSMPEWQGLVASSAEDAVAAAFGAAHFAFDLLERLPAAVKEPLEQAAQAAEAHTALEEQLAQLDALLDGMDAETIPGALQEQRESVRAQEDQARRESETAFQAALRSLDAAQARTTEAVSVSLLQSAQELSDLKAAARAFGVGWGAGNGIPSRQSVAALEEIAQRLRQSPQLRLLLQELGWAKRLVAAQVRQTQHGRDSFTHYQMGEFTPEDLAGEELVGLLSGDPTSPLAVDFLARALDGDLLHRRYEGEEGAGRGPIVFVRDTSGSMQSPPAKNAVAAALELALMQWALREKRRFISIPFSGPGQFSVYDPGPKPDLTGLLEHLSFGYWGGTEPYAPLLEAFQKIQSDPSLKQGDVLILTDGAFRPAPPDFLQVLQAVRDTPGLRLVAVVVGHEAGAADFADSVVLIRDLLSDRAALAEAVRTIVHP